MKLNSFKIGCAMLALIRGLLHGETISVEKENVVLRLEMSTNIVSGMGLPVSVVVSNTLDVDRYFRWQNGDPCRAGIGEFVINDKVTGKKMECVVPMDERTAQTGRGADIQPHSNQAMPIIDLATKYGLTNAGQYSVKLAAHLLSRIGEGGRFEYVDFETPAFQVTIVPAEGISANLETNTTVIPEKQKYPTPVIQPKDAAVAPLEDSKPSLPESTLPQPTTPTAQVAETMPASPSTNWVPIVVVIFLGLGIALFLFRREKK
jgi:hypothetical protein